MDGPTLAPLTGNTQQYVVQDPQGQKHVISGPKGATPQQVLQQAQQMFPQKQQQQPMMGGQPQMPQMGGQPQQPPPQMGGQPQPQQQPAAQSPMGGQQQPFNGVDPQKLLNLYRQANPQGAQQLIGQLLNQRMGTSTLDPLKKAQANYYEAKAKALGSGGGPSGGKSTVYVSPDGSVSTTETPGSTPRKVSDAQALQYTAVPNSSKGRNAALQSRVEAMNRSMDTKQIDALVKGTGLTPKQQSAIQQNSFRAARAIPILSKPKITYQELALGQIDLAGLMQGGVPQVDEVKAIQFPGYQKTLGDIVTYATGNPQEVVPDAVRKKVLDLVKGTVEVDNRFINANQKFMNSMLVPTIRGGLKTGQTQAISDITEILTLQEPNKTSSQGAYSDLGKEQRYQDFLRSQNAAAQ